MVKENISAIIPINKFNNIKEVINSLIDLVAEIIIINSSNNNLNLNDKKIKIYNVNKPLKASEARNLGYEKTASDYLLFIDSDVILTENGRKFIQNLDLSILNNKIIGGMYAIDDKANQISNINSLILIYRFLNFKECNENCEFISSSHFIISKKKFAELGLFNENLSFWEDVDLSVRARFLGNKLEIHKSFQAIHKKKI
jgi:GT2 family glycosyltransferase